MSKIDIKINVQTSKLNKLTLFEKPDVIALNKLINSDLLKETFHCKMTGNVYQNEKQQLIAYRSLINKDGLVPVRYEKAKGMKYGRVFPAKSLGAVGIRRELRGTLFNNNMVDIDIENCHPELSNQICEANGLKNKYLNRYVKNRPELLQQIQEQYSVDRDSAKTLFIMLLYFGSFERWGKDRNISDQPIEFVTKFKKELSSIGDHIIKENEDLRKAVIKIKDSGKSEHQIKSSTVSYYFQEIENQILETVYLYCVDKGYINKCCSLAYDGLMIPKELYKVELLSELNILIRNKFGFDLKFVEKKQVHYLDILDDHIVVTEPELDEYNSLKVEFEKNNFKILNPISYATIDQKGDLLIRNKTDFYNVYENLRYNTIKKGESVEVSFVEKWFKDKEMRTFDRIDFLPQQEAPKDVFNTFKGYEAEKKELYDVDIENSLIIKHLKNLCNNEDDSFQYIVKTLAMKIQKPYNITNTAIVFKSDEGAGKDLFLNYFGNQILGSDLYLNTQKPELIFGKFSSCLENKVLVVLNESSGKDTFSINENIKCAITAQTNIIEHKGMKPYKNTNHIEYVFLTNNDNPLKVPQGDRRFCGIECNNDVCNDKDYFDALRTEIDSGKVDKAFYNYLLSIDVDNYDFTNNRPITKFYNDMKEINIPPIALFLESLVMNNNLNTTYKIESTTLYRQYTDYISTYNFKCVPTLTKFVLDIKKIDGVEQTRSSTSRSLVFDLIKLKEYLITTYNINFDITVEDDDDDITTVSTMNLLDR